MSVLQVYISWANSLLCETNRAADNVAAVQDGMVLCELIDILAPDAGLMTKIQASGTPTQRAYIQMAIDHMKNHGIKVTFTAQDIIDGDIKSLLDVMWLLILNYGIHFIGQISSQRSVGVAKKNLLEWCQFELEAAFDPKNTLSLNLCTGNWFMKLLQKFAGCHVDEGEDKATHLYNLLKEIEERYGIRNTIISPNDIIDGTVDEHTLMIYLSLLKRRVCNTARSPRREMLSVDGKEAAMARVEERNRSASEEAANRRRHTEVVGLGLQQLHQQQQQQQQQKEGKPKRSSSVDSGPPPVAPKPSVQTRSQESVESSDWLSSETNSLLSGRDRSPGERGAYLITEAENVLMQTISERVKEHMPLEQDEDKDTDASLGHSERDTESMSEFSSGALDEGYVTVRGRASHRGGGNSSSSFVSHTANGKTQQNGTTATRKPEITVNGSSSNGNAKKSTTEPETTISPTTTTTTSTTRINIKRPKDYYLQWEETIDRLSQGPPVPPDVSDMSPRSPREILRGIEDIHSPRSPRQPFNRSYSSESEVYGTSPYVPVWKRREYFEGRPSSQSPSTRYRQALYSPRSSSTPQRGSDSERSERSERSVASERSTAQRRQSPRSPRTGRESRAERNGDRRSPTENGHQAQRQEESSNGRQPQPRASSSPAPSLRLPQLNSAFMERLEELKRSGRAQRVILPDLGPDAPVLMIPGQGEEVLLLFDALRQARLEVDSNLSTRTTTNGTAATNGSGTKSPARTSPVEQRNEETTEVKKLAKADTTETKATSPRRSPTQEEEKDVVGRLPRPKIHRHRFSKPTDIRVTDLRTGRLRDPRRTKSMSEKGNVISPLVVPIGEPFRYHSLSPRRETSPPLTSDSIARERVSLRELRDRVDAVVIDTVPFRRVKPSTVESITDPIQRSYENSASSSPVGFRPSPSTSPYSRQLRSSPFHSLSPLRTLSPCSAVIDGLSERIPLNLPDEITSSPGHSPTRLGGQGRVPRREAWERQRQREGRPFTSTGTDSLAQAKFIEVLCKEIEELKQKVEIMEESSPERRSLSRGRPGTYTTATATTTTPTGTGQNDTFYTSRSEIKETESDMMLAPKEGGTTKIPATAVQTQRTRHSPRPWESSARTGASPPRATSPRHRPGASPRHQTQGREPMSTTASEKSRGRQPASSPDRTALRAEEAASTKRKPGAEKLEGASTPGRTNLGRSGKPISLGYKSPIRSVTQEIWGKDLTSVEGLEPDRRDTYKRLISQRSLGEGDVIELKQSLASAVVENDILQAKLNNARHEIQEKLSKTNEVLDDCRRHLAKSQAENMELRTALEREKVRAETSEGRGRDLEILIKQLRADNAELEEELDHTLSILDRSKPGIEALKHENTQLLGKAATFQNENNTLKRDIEDMRKSQFKSINTIRELRNCLDELRQERGDLQQKVSKLERTQNDSKMKAILTHYNEEKGSKDETERESNSSGVSSASERFRSTQSTSARRSSSRNDELTPRSSLPSKSADSSTVSGISPGRGHNYSFDDVSPTVPSAYREIYPHRKPRFRNLSAERYGSPDRMDSPVAFIDYPDLQHYPTKLDDMDDDYATDEVAYRRSPLPRDDSPIRRPVPYRPYSVDNTIATTSYSAMPERPVETPRDRSRSRTKSPHCRGRSPIRSSRTPQSLKEPRSASASPVRALSTERLNRSYDSVMFDLRKQRSASSSPGRYGDSMKGILKNGNSSAGRDRDRSSSPRYGARSHSPPTRLSPTDKVGGKDSKSAQIKMFPRTEVGEIARNLQREFDKEDCILDGLRKKHRSKSWFELQLDDTDCPSGVELAEALGEEHLLLSEEQRNYANQLIHKYTGRKL